MNKKASIALETALLTVLVTIAWLTMQFYFKRAIQGNWRTNANSFSDEQYDSDLSIENYSGYDQPPIYIKKPFINVTIVTDPKAGTVEDAGTIKFTTGEVSGKIKQTGEVLQIPGDWGTYRI